jgi:hypothetical protein
MPFHVYLDNSGTALNGGKLHFYEGGTSTPKTTWADSAMQSANDNPVVLDSTGRATIFVRGLYKVVLKDSNDVTIDTWDYLFYPNISTAGASLIDDTSVANMRATLGLGTAAILNVGTSGNEIVQLTAAAKLPAVDGSLLTNVSTSYTAPLPYGHVSGLQFTRVSGTTFSLTAGECRDTTDTYNLSLSSTMIKSLSAWAVGTGNGSLDTGSIAPSTWYHVFLVGTSAGLTDIAISVEGNLVPTLTSLGDYDYYAFAGVSFLLDGSSQIIDMKHDGDNFLWVDPPLSINASGVGATNVDRELTVPPDYKVDALINATFANPDSPAAIYLRSLDANNEAATGDTTAPLCTIVAPTEGARYSSGPSYIRTNASQTIGSRANVANSSLDIVTLGWHYLRSR